MSLTHDLQYAVELARGAGKIILSHYGKVRRLTKRQEEAVTDADRASQRFIVSGLTRRFPNDGLCGEENDTGDAITFNVSDPRGRVWVIDPIDGTNNFIAGLGNFAVCIGLLENGLPVLGVVYDVTRDLMYTACSGEGAWLDSRRLHAAQTPLDSASMVMLSSNLIDTSGSCPAWANRWLGQTEWKVRILGSAAIEAVQVAAGVAHATITLHGKLWDIAAPAAILFEAGARLSDPKGEPIFPYNLAGYSGAKVPFIAAAPTAYDVILEDVRRR